MTPQEFLDQLDLYNDTMPINRVSIDDANWTDEQVLWLLDKYATIKEDIRRETLLACICEREGLDTQPKIKEAMEWLDKWDRK